MLRIAAVPADRPAAIGRHRNGDPLGRIHIDGAVDRDALLGKSSPAAPHERRSTDHAAAAHPPISSRFSSTAYDQLL
jgi:hypothetical protein